MSGKVTVLTVADMIARLECRMRHVCPGAVGSLRVYGVPRGGALALHYGRAYELGMVPVTTPEIADVIVDDIIDSGRTREYWMERFPRVPFVGLVDKLHSQEDTDLGWVVFPWEKAPGTSGEQDRHRDAEDNVTRMLEHIGEDPRREGLRETPARVVKSWGSLFGGYNIDPASVFKVFQEGACDEMVLLKGIEFYSTCEHHMIPFAGTASIAYIPNGKVIGVSKLVRLLEVYARRLQIQERLTQQITTALDQYLQPLGSACVLNAQHMCMTARGVQKQGSRMVTSSLTGVFKTNPQTRSEFLQLAGA